MLWIASQTSSGGGLRFGALHKRMNHELCTATAVRPSPMLGGRLSGKRCEVFLDWVYLNEVFLAMAGQGA